MSVSTGPDRPFDLLAADLRSIAKSVESAFPSNAASLRGIAAALQGSPLWHLEGQTCRACGHSYADHLHTPACRECDCRLDPKCVCCGRLSSMHEDQP